MASVHDVAAYILSIAGPMTAMKLQKLVYYSQAWSLVWDEKPLFPEKIEAWANGPVVPALYEGHRGLFMVEKWSKGNPEALEQVEKDTINGVLGFYNDKTAQWLSDLTHQEDPWKNARRGIGLGQHCRNEISLSAIAEYYASLG